MKKKQKNICADIILILLAACILLPAATLLLWTFTERWAWPDLLPADFSMRAVLEVAGRKGQLMKILVSSVLISTVVSVLSAVIAIMTARAMVFYKFRGKKLIYFLTVLPFMVPATVFAMGIQITFIKLGLNNTVAGVILAHLICSLPYAVRLITDGTEAAGSELEEQARVLGASGWQAFYKVALPIMSPVILAAVSMAYIVSFSQYFLTLIIGGGNIRTFTIVMVPYLQGGNRNIACVYSVVFLGLTMAVFALFEWLINKWTKNNSGEFYA